MRTHTGEASTSDAQYEVVVAGGGLGGVAAAVSAARAGAKTALIERNAFLGGVATAGMCCSMFNGFFTSQHELVTRGIPLEIADTLAETAGYGRAWQTHKGHIIFDLEDAKMALDALACDAGVDVFFCSTLTGAITENNRLVAATFEDKSGTRIIRADVCVDATGDADLAAKANAVVKTVVRGSHSLCFRLGNVDMDTFVDYFKTRRDQYPEYMDVEWTVDEALAQYDECGTFLFPHGGGMQMEAFSNAAECGDLPSHVGIHDTTDACQMHGMKRTGILHVITGFSHFNGIESGLLGRSLVDGRKMARIVADVYRAYLPGFESSCVVGTAANLGVRVSRYIEGDFVFTEDMMQANMKQDDAVGTMIGWDNIRKHPGDRAWNMQAMRSGPFQLPYRCLIPKGVKGLLMGAGRSVSSENPALLRTMVHTMVVGQAAGAAASVSAREKTDPSDVSIEAVQKVLSEQGINGLV